MLLLIIDLWSKSAAFNRLAPDEGYNVFPGILEFRRSLNDGAVFGSFTGYVSVFIGASILALGFVLYLFRGSSPRQRLLHVALGLILAGALGNLYDRMFMIADVVVQKSRTGRDISTIGVIVSKPDDPVIRLGTWPEGDHVQTFRRSDVTIRRQGVVRDFLKFLPRFPKWVPKLGGRDVWPWIFNVADAALVVGVAALLLMNLREHRSHHHPSESPEPAA